MSYLRADGIILPPDDAKESSTVDLIDAQKDDTEDDHTWSDGEEDDPSTAWPETHARVMACIQELGGSVTPKLNWSAPKDATWISATNSMDCRSANDIYLLLKSSDFVVHDLEQAFNGCEDVDQAHLDPSESNVGDSNEIPYHLILRKTIPAYNPSMEFRCFVKERDLLCICQRDLNHYDFLRHMAPDLRRQIQEFFRKHLARSFADPNFAFDVYIPAPHTRVWLVDINPWAPRTDPLLFSWLELLEMPTLDRRLQESDEIMNANNNGSGSESDQNSIDAEEHKGETDSDNDSEETEEGLYPELRIVERDDPEGYAFNTPQYSAHKLPKDVVDAGVEGEAGLREFVGRWKELVDNQGDIQSANDSDDNEQ